MADKLLKEDGFYILQETSFGIILEQSSMDKVSSDSGAGSDVTSVNLSFLHSKDEGFHDRVLTG